MKIVIIDGPLKGQEYPLEKKRVKVGRKSDADICLSGDNMLSRYHCLLSLREDGWYIEDLGSGNGTYLAGDLVREPTLLVPRRLARIGTSHFILVDAPSRTGGGWELKAESTPYVDPTPSLAPRSFDQWESPTQVRLQRESQGEFHIATSLDPTVAPALTKEWDNAMVQRLDAHLRAVRRVSKAIAGKPEPIAMFEAVIESLLEVVPAQRAFLLEVSEDGEELKALVTRTRSAKHGKDLTISQTVLNQSVRGKMAILIKDAKEDENLAEVDSVVLSAMRSAICVPLLDSGKVLALLYFDTKAALALTEDDLELVTAAGHQAALGMNNARLYQQLKQAYEDLEKAHEHLVQSEKLSIIGTLAASIAHDIGNVLTPISGVAKIVMRLPEVNPKLKEAFERQMKRLKALTQQLLSFSSPAPPTLLPLDINAQLEDSLGLVTTELRHAQVEVVTDLAEGLPDVAAEAGRLDQVIVNLCINAGHAMAGKGGKLSIRSFQDGDMVSVDVSDEGCGIPAEGLKQIFEPFFTTKGDDGTGLGLFSCKRVIEEEHGGKLTVVSELGVGTTFTLSLPVAAKS